MSISSMGKGSISAITTAITTGDNIAAYLVDSAGSLLTSTLLGGKQRLDVMNPSEFAEDSAHVSGDYGMQMLAVRNDAGTSLVSADGDYGSLQLDSVGRLRVLADLTASFDFTYSEDSAHVSGDVGAFILSVRNDANSAFTSADGDYSPINVDSAGRVGIRGSQLEDAASSSGDSGFFNLGIYRVAPGVNVSAAGDYAELQINAQGELRVNDKVETSTLQQIVSVATTATKLPTTPLANRKSLMVQNVAAKKIYLGSATVTADETATGGLQLNQGAFYEGDISSSVDIYGIVASGTANAVVWEFK